MPNQYLVLDRHGRITDILNLQPGETVMPVTDAVISRPVESKSLWLPMLRECMGTYALRPVTLPTDADLDRWVNGWAAQGFNAKIKMIKELRDMTQGGLAECKRYVDWLTANCVRLNQF